MTLISLKFSEEFVKRNYITKNAHNFEYLLNRDVNGIMKKMPGSRGSRGNALVGGPRGQRPLGETEFSHFYSLKIGLSWTEVG